MSYKYTGEGLIITDTSITFEGATDDEYETVLAVTDPTADRTLTLPDATDTLIGKATTDTLTNKTLTSPVVNVTSDATGDVYYRNGSGAFTRLAVGSNDQVLTLASGVPSWGTAGGTDRYSISNRFRSGALGSTSNVYFTDDVDTSGNQFYVAKSVAHGATIAVDSDWLSGFEGGAQWQAPRACTLTQIAATSRINANASCHTVRVSVWKATPVNNNTYSTDITWTEIGTADLTNDGSTGLVDYQLQTVNTAISSGNSVSAADCLIIGFQPVGGTTAATSYFQVTLEFTVA